MNVALLVKDKIDGYKEREPIFIKGLNIPYEYNNARDCALNKLEKKNIIKQYRRGIYYKPKTTPFGEIGIDKEKVIIRQYIETANKERMGYITGPTLWYNLDLTTQIPNRKWIVTNNISRNIEDKELKIKLIKTKEKITNENYDYFKVIDIIDQIEQIQDLDTSKLKIFIENELSELRTDQLEELLRIATKYKKSTVRTLGAVIEVVTRQNYNNNTIINKLKEEYSYGKKNKVKNLLNLNNIREWGLY